MAGKDKDIAEKRANVQTAVNKALVERWVAEKAAAKKAAQLTQNITADNSEVQEIAENKAVVKVTLRIL